jgi:hypothetical protein
MMENHDEDENHATLAGFVRGLARSLGRGGARTMKSVTKGRIPGDRTIVLESSIDPCFCFSLLTRFCPAVRGVAKVPEFIPDSDYCLDTVSSPLS